MKRTHVLSYLGLQLAIFSRAQLPPPPPLQPWELEGDIDTARAFATDATLIAPTNLTRNDYLVTIAAVLYVWRSQQASNGSIIDPITHQEMQYSTPCFAWAAALLCINGTDRASTWCEPASLALDFSISSMLNGSDFCAQATCDFYALPVMKAFLALRGQAQPARVATWASQLQMLNPNKTFEFTGQNWELTAAAGEFIRMEQLGWTNGHGNWSLWEARIGRLATINGLSPGGFWNSNGQFQDNWGQDKTSPHAYDAFGSAYTVMLLNLGYNASEHPYAAYLSSVSERGVWTHALFQGPWGEIPVGGRSGQHQWNEAVMAAQYEAYAIAAWANGDAQAACQLRRSARLSHASVRRWMRPTGMNYFNALQIVKNWFSDPEQRWGYESYSFFSQYNILPMAWLANAYDFAADNDAIPECAAIADVGGVAFALPYPTFRKVFASAMGTYVEVMTGADPEYESTGLYRVQFRGCSVTAPGQSAAAGGPCAFTVGSLLGPSAAPPLSASLPLGVATAIGGVWWAVAGDAPTMRRSLANNTLQSVLASVFTPGSANTPTATGFTLQYVLWDEGVLVTETYALVPGSVTVSTGLRSPGQAALFALMSDAAAGLCAQCTLMQPSDSVVMEAIKTRDVEALLSVRPFHGVAKPPFSRFGVSFPAFVFDGTTNFTVTSAANTTTVAGGPVQGSIAYTVAAPAGHTLQWETDPTLGVPTRNGVVQPVYAEISPVDGATPSIVFTISVASPATEQ